MGSGEGDGDGVPFPGQHFTDRHNLVTFSDVNPRDGHRNPEDLCLKRNLEMVLDHGVKTSGLFRLAITIDDRFFDETVQFGFAQSKPERLNPLSRLRPFPLFHEGVPSCLVIDPFSP